MVERIGYAIGGRGLAGGPPPSQQMLQGQKNSSPDIKNIDMMPDIKLLTGSGNTIDAQQVFPNDIAISIGDGTFVFNGLKFNSEKDLMEYMDKVMPFRADGGRIGLREGGIGNLRGALSKQMFGYDEDDDEIIRKKTLAYGGSAGMPPVTMQTEGQNIQSFPDDESMNMAQRPQNPMPMKQPMMNPMMDPIMMQQMMMASKMNPQMMSGRMTAAMGGRMGYANGGSLSELEIFKLKNLGYTNADDPIRQQEYGGIDVLKDILRVNRAMGGRMGYAEGGDEGELLDMGGLEKDYRNDGGFVPMGEYERKDDVPARLSKNEFVFTADAVRNAGGGDIDKGAEIMENMMTNLENGGQVSQGSQGLDGAREMFATQQRLGEVL